MEEEITARLHHAIDVLEGLEELMEQAATPELEQILQKAWLEVTNTFPEEFRDATRLDASAEGLRRYLRVRAFFTDPTHPVPSYLDFALYSLNHESEIDEDSADFFFPD